MEKIKIGFFDSGIGGVTVLKRCLKLNPHFEYIYYSDSKNNPYGDKSEEEIIGFSEEISGKLIKEGCKIIVIACNTASAISSKTLREKYKDTIFVAIEPAIKQALDSEEETLIIATKGTLESKKFIEHYEKYHRENFYKFECVGLADLIEKNEKEQINRYLENNLKQFKGKVKNVVLGCTHYPLIKNEISNVLGNVNFFDGAYGVARQLERIIRENKFEGEKNDILFMDSSNNEQKEKRFWEILKQNIEL